jgi:hypothetical protein
MKKLILISIVIFLFGVSAFAQLTPKEPKWLGKKSVAPSCSILSPSWYFDTVAGTWKFCTGTNTFTSLGSGGGASIGGAVTGGTTGSILYINASGQLAQANGSLFYDATNATVFLGDSTYLGNTVGASSGWSGSKSFLKIGFDTALANSTQNVYGAQFDMKRSMTSGSWQTSGIRPRCWVQASGTAATPICTGVESFVDNTGSTVETNLQGVEGIVNQPAISQWTVGGWFSINSTANTSFADWGVRSALSRSAGTSVKAVVFEGVASTSSTGAITELIGLNLGGWSGSNIANSSAIKIAADTNRGTTTAWAINSLSTAPSLLTGKLYFGTNYSTTGLINFPNNLYFYARNAANSADVKVIGLNSSDAIQLGDTQNVNFGGRLVSTDSSGDYVSFGSAKFGDVLADGHSTVGIAADKSFKVYDELGNTVFQVRGTSSNTGTTSFFKGGNVASASAIVPTGNLFHVTGTTTITSITATNITAGTCITIIFDAALTFTDGSNLKLNGNFVTTADDTISLCYDGTNWYEKARSAN